MHNNLTFKDMRLSLLYITAIAALALSSCSGEDSPEVGKEGITYNVVTEDATRSDDVFGSSRRPREFFVWANTDGDSKPYFSDNRVEYTLSGWEDTDGMKYWPVGKTLNFFAHVNGGSSFEFNGGNPRFYEFAVNGNASEQLDLMYAVSPGLANSGQPVTLTFRHALAMVTFAASNSMPGINLEISSVEVCNLAGKGTFNFPKSTVTGKEGSSEDSEEVWVVEKDFSHTFSVAMSGDESVLVKPDGASVNLTGIVAGALKPAKNVMMLLPQSVKAWEPQGGKADGAYVRIYVKVFSADDNGLLREGYSIVPLEVDWKAGGNYNYSLNFNEGSAVGFTDNLIDPKPFFKR